MGNIVPNISDIGCCSADRKPEKIEGGRDYAYGPSYDFSTTNGPSYEFSSGSTFYLQHRPREPTWSLCARIIEDELPDAHKLVESKVDTTATTTPRLFQPAAEALNAEWAPAVNLKLQEYGYEVSAFEWSDKVWIAGDTKNISRLSIRIKYGGACQSPVSFPRPNGDPKRTPRTPRGVLRVVWPDKGTPAPLSVSHRGADPANDFSRKGSKDK
mmetsp:Transcript_41690/g.77739  ORF Transcript_41690/g.77739 Transcript_41690/m.77739 type:complete len:213 (-) Transcript_41690:196-834(-)